MTIFNPAGAFGQTATPEYGTINVVNSTTTAITKNKVVRLSSGLTDGFKVDSSASLGATDVVGVLDADMTASGVGLAVTRGVHLVAVTSDATPVRGALLVTSSSTAGALKTSTYAAASEPAGAVVAIALSSTLDSSGTFISALLKIV